MVQRPFKGLCESIENFQIFMVYLDDIFVPSKTLTEHLEHLHLVFISLG